MNADFNRQLRTGFPPATDYRQLALDHGGHQGHGESARDAHYPHDPQSEIGNPQSNGPSPIFRQSKTQSRSSPKMRAGLR